MGHDAFWIVVQQFVADLLAFTQREFITEGLIPVGGEQFSFWTYLLPLVTLFFAGIRQFGSRRWLLGLIFLGITVYLVHNRLTTFKQPHATLASTLGNAFFLLLGLLYLLPPAWRHRVLGVER